MNKCRIPERDQELLEWGGERVLNLRHGVRVHMTLFRFKADENKPPLEFVSNRVEPEDGPKFFDPGYFYAPYIPG